MKRDHIRIYSIFIFLSLSVLTVCRAQSLRAGPMLGYIEMQEANIWLQTTGPAAVEIKYWKKGSPGKAKWVKVGQTGNEQSFTKKIKLVDLDYGTEYRYEIYLDGEKVNVSYPLEFKTQQLWQWRTDPPDFSFAFGSCLYINDPPYDRPGDPYGTEPDILLSISKKDPDLMIWTGDNVYYREPDFYSVPRMDYRYADARDTPQMQQLLAGSVNLAVWDDHDYGPNNSGRSYRMRNESLAIFKRYWVNPGYGIQGVDGVFTRYLYNDVEFFLLDGRYYRAPVTLKDPDKHFFGREQLQWLKDALLSSNATFKIIVSGTQFTNPGGANESYRHESFMRYKDEFNRLMYFLKEHKVEGVLFLSGDVHYSQLLKTERKDAYPIYEFTSSPLSAGVYPVAENEEDYINPVHVPGTLVTEHNFGLINVTGPRKNRRLILENYDRNGERNWKYEITRDELSIK